MAKDLYKRIYMYIQLYMYIYICIRIFKILFLQIYWIYFTLRMSRVMNRDLNFQPLSNTSVFTNTNIERC